MADTKLAACPFCGTTEDLSIQDCVACWVACESLACTNAEGPLGGTREEAIAAWNRRPAPVLTPKQEAADDLFDALKGLEAANDRRAELCTAAAYETALSVDGMPEALNELDAARRIARATLTKAGQP